MAEHFNPFAGLNSGGGGGTSESVRYTIKKETDGTSGKVTYKLMQSINDEPQTVAGEVIGFNGNSILVNYGDSVALLNTAIENIEELLDKTYNFTTFSELNIDTHNKTLTQITQELIAKNLPANTIVTGQLYSSALPFNGNGEAEVIVNPPAYWWTCKSLNVAPYSWNALTASSTWGDQGIVIDWTPDNYTLPVATSSTLGGVKIGNGIDVTQDGTISINVDSTPTNQSQNLITSGGVAAALSAKADLENGLVPISQLPPAVIEKMVTVADDTARFALTINEVQLGDTVKVVSTNKMYMIIDTENLDKEAGYQVYVAGRAAEAVADQNGNTINTTYATTTDVETALMTKANKTDIVTYIAGSNISIIPTDNKIDLFEYAWSNVAPTDTTTWQTIADSKSLTSAIIDLENITKFKLQAATKQTHTIFFAGAYVDSNDVLHEFPSSSLNPEDGQIKQDTEIEVPSGYVGIRLVARLDSPAYLQGSEVHESDFDYIRIEIIEGTHSKAFGETKKTISAVDQMQSDWNQSDNTSPDYIKNKPTIPAAQVNSDWNAVSGAAEILNKPSLGTASALNVSANGDATTTEVVKGDDSRLTDSRNAADVYSWAKAATKPTYTASEVGAVDESNVITTAEIDLMFA